MLVNGLATSLSTTTLGTGGHAVVALYSGDPSYGGNTGTFTQQVAKANLTAIADDQSATRYAGLPPLTLSLTGFVNGEDATSAGVVVTADQSTTATAASPAGYYPIQANVTSLVAANYQLGGVQDGTLTMKPRGDECAGRPRQRPDRVADRPGPRPAVLQHPDDPGRLQRQRRPVRRDHATARHQRAELRHRAPSYDPSTFTATWTLPVALDADRLTLNLSGVTARRSTGPGRTSRPTRTA